MEAPGPGDAAGGGRGSPGGGSAGSAGKAPEPAAAPGRSLRRLPSNSQAWERAGSGRTWRRPRRRERAALPGAHPCIPPQPRHSLGPSMAKHPPPPRVHTAHPSSIHGQTPPPSACPYVPSRLHPSQPSSMHPAQLCASHSMSIHPTPAPSIPPCVHLSHPSSLHPTPCPSIPSSSLHPIPCPSIPLNSLHPTPCPSIPLHVPPSHPCPSIPPSSIHPTPCPSIPPCVPPSHSMSLHPTHVHPSHSMSLHPTQLPPSHPSSIHPTPCSSIPPMSLHPSPCPSTRLPDIPTGPACPGPPPDPQIGAIRMPHASGILPPEQPLLPTHPWSAGKERRRRRLRKLDIRVSVWERSPPAGPDRLPGPATWAGGRGLNWHRAPGTAAPAAMDCCSEGACPKLDEDILDIPLDDPDANAAAAKIQASFRGHMTRKKIKGGEMERKTKDAECAGGARAGDLRNGD